MRLTLHVMRWAGDHKAKPDEPGSILLLDHISINGERVDFTGDINLHLASGGGADFITPSVGGLKNKVDIGNITWGSTPTNTGLIVSGIEVQAL